MFPFIEMVFSCKIETIKYEDAFPEGVVCFARQPKVDDGRRGKNPKLVDVNCERLSSNFHYYIEYQP